MESPEDQQHYWDRKATDTTFSTPLDLDRFKSHVSQQATILDIGCGHGRIMDQLYRQGFTNIVGVDFSRQMLKLGKASFPGLDFAQASLALPFRNNSFDAVVLMAVLTCIPDGSHQKQLMKEITRVLKENGVVYITDFMINTDPRNQERYTRCNREPYGVFELDDGAVLRHHSREHLVQLTTDFEERVFKKTVFVTMHQHRSNGFYYIGRKQGI
ncbi:MAG: class I SAM-dependent methyltransferase [Desulfobacterium sp.]|nr:class I SAM-dependent methyltransferase [Desulfobacterium sp.]